MFPLMSIYLMKIKQIIELYDRKTNFSIFVCVVQVVKKAECLKEYKITKIIPLDYYTYW